MLQILIEGVDLYKKYFVMKALYIFRLLRVVLCLLFCISQYSSLRMTEQHSLEAYQYHESVLS